MKRIAAVVLSVALMFGAGACTDNSDSLTETSTTVDSDVRDDVFLGLVRDNAPGFKTTSDEMMLAMAENVCDSWDRNLLFSDITIVFLNRDYSAYDSGFFIGAATAGYCPEHNSKIPS